MNTPHSSSNDQNFDGLVEHFENKIYGSLKGQLRLRLIKQELLQQIPALKNRTHRILDVAGGLGQIAIWLAGMGHQVIIADISIEMINRSKQLAENAGISHNIQWFHVPLQQLEQLLQEQKIDNKFDLILAHAILEWMEDPEKGFKNIASLTKPKTKLSLTFYNRQAILLFNLIKGNFHKVLTDNFRGDAGGLTPLNPLHPDVVRNWVKAQNLIIQNESGLRSFYDYMPKNIKQKISDEDIFEMEHKLSKQQPFIDIARYIHFILEPGDKTTS